VLSGNDGDDLLVGGEGYDRVYGGAGNDTVDLLDDGEDYANCGGSVAEVVLSAGPFDTLDGCVI
jgi:Ca2+-binding RTX toxin-like protein